MTERYLTLLIKHRLGGVRSDNHPIQHRWNLSRYELKEKVHPKMKILSSFTHPQVVPNLYEFVLPNTKEDILKKVWKQFWGTVDFIIKKKYHGS